MELFDPRVIYCACFDRNVNDLTWPLRRVDRKCPEHWAVTSAVAGFVCQKSGSLFQNCHLVLMCGK